MHNLKQGQVINAVDLVKKGQLYYLEEVECFEIIIKNGSFVKFIHVSTQQARIKINTLYQYLIPELKLQILKKHA